jgi:hypothetical protein
VTKQRTTRTLTIAVPSFFVSFCVAIVVLWWTLEPWSTTSIEESQRRAAPIITAIGAYHADHDELPPNLQALVPNYLDDIVRPTAGSRQWLYAVRGNASFALSFGCGADHYPNCTYSSRSRHWMIDH